MYVNGDAPHYGQGESIICKYIYIYSVFTVRMGYDTKSRKTSPTGYMAEILLSSPIPHWVHVSLSIPHWVHGRDPPLLPHPPLGTSATECPPLRTWQRSSSPPHPPLGTCVSECPPLRTWQTSSFPLPSPTGYMCH